MTEIDRMSPLLSLMGLQGNNTNSFLIQFSIGNARDGAWCFAEDLSKQTGDGYAATIKTRDTSEPPAETWARTPAETRAKTRHEHQWHHI